MGITFNWTGRGYRVETWQNDRGYLELPLCIKTCVCICLAVCTQGMSKGYKCLGTILLEMPCFYW